MEISINVQIGITEDLKTFLKELAGFVPAKPEPKLKVVPPQEEKKSEPVKPESNGKKEETKKKEKSDAAPLTIENVRAVMAPLQANGKRAQLKSILTGMGYENIPSLPEDKYAEFIDKMKAL